MKTAIELDLLTALVAFPTVSGNTEANARALDFVENYLEMRGMYTVRETYKSFDSLIATTRNTKTPTVMLVAHIDVVPAPMQQFTVREEDGKLYGRGVWDMKMAIAGYMALVDQLQDSLSEYDFGIMIVSDEEENDETTGELLARGYSSRVVVLPDGAADWRVESHAKGSWRLCIAAQGRAAHGSRPWEGDSAVLKLMDTLDEIRPLFKDNKQEESSLNIGTFSGGEAANQVPDYAEAGLDVRAPTTAEYERLEQAMQAICEKHDVTMTMLHFLPVLEHDLANPYFVNFIRSIEKVTRTEHTGFMSYGASSAIHFMERSIPCILTEPTGGDRHGSREWLDKKSFLYFVPIIRDFMEQSARTTAMPTEHKRSVLEAG